MPTVPLHSAPPKTPIKVIRRIGAQSVPAISAADSAALLLRLVDLVLQLGGARVDELELRELCVEDADDLCELCCVRCKARGCLVLSERRGGRGTYGVVGLAGFAEGLGCAVDFFDHLGEVLVELVEAVL